MTAVLDPPVSQPRPEVMYASRRESLKLVYRAEYPIFGPQGQRTGVMTDGARLPFVEGVLRVPLTGTIRTEQNRQIPAAEVLEWLERHPLNGDRHEGFFKVDQVAPPVSEQEIDRIAEMAMLGDLEGLKALVEAESAGWKRSQILNVAGKRIGQLEEFAAQMEAQRAAEEAEAKAKPAQKKAAQ